jgi:hypothetical protein
MKLSEAEYLKLVNLVATELKKMGFDTDPFECDSLDGKSTMMIHPVKAITEIVNGITTDAPKIRISINLPPTDNAKPVAAEVLGILLKHHSKDKIEYSGGGVGNMGFLTLQNLGATPQVRESNLRSILNAAKLDLAEAAMKAIRDLRNEIEGISSTPFIEERTMLLTRLALKVRDHTDSPEEIINLCIAADRCRNRQDSRYAGPAMFKEVSTQTESVEVASAVKAAAS